MTLAEVAGRTYGPAPVAIATPSVAAFVAATGDDPGRWSAHAPPSFAAAALFAVAPAFLSDPEVAPQTRSLIHTEQRFTWHRALEIGETIEVSGKVADVRERRGLNLVTFELAAGDWLDGTATFLMSSEAAAGAEPEPEPPHDSRAAFDPAVSSPLPQPGEDLPPMARSASRADLVRYSGASGDWNPLHWDHEAAVGAGLSGTVVHGLLMASWLTQAAARHAPGPHPVSGMRLRFRKPLRPAAPAEITGTAEDDGGVKLAVSSGGVSLVTATARVTA